MKYKVGDYVTIRRDLTVGCVERPKNDTDDFWTITVLPEMAAMAGQRVRITQALDYANRYHVEGSFRLWCDTMFEEVSDQKIVITTDGVETLARFYEGDKVIKTATAKCSPEDRFDFKTGAELAFNRLYEDEKVEKPTTNHEFKVGEWARVLRDRDCHYAQIGSIVQIMQVYEHSYRIKRSDGELRYISKGDLAPIEWRVVDRKPKVGDYIRLMNYVANYSFDREGDILRVDDVFCDYGVQVLGKNHIRPTGDDNFHWAYCDYNYRVIEPVEG